MRALVQLVSEAKVTVGNRITGAITTGLVILLGVRQGDTEKDARYLADKIANLRIFPDADGVMNRSILEEKGEMLVVSQFTLFGDCRKGRRPSYSKAAPPDEANKLYQYFIQEIEKLGIKAATGEFQAMMQVALINNGPVTILLDSEKTF